MGTARSEDTTDDTTDDSVRRLGMVVATLRSLMAHGGSRMEEAVGLPASQVAVLRAVGDGAGSVSGVADRLLSHVSNASRAVDALVRADLVDRSPDPDDRRAVVLAVTRDGRARLDELDQHRDAMMVQALDDLSAAERLTFVGLLERFVDGLDRGVRQHPDDRA